MNSARLQRRQRRLQLVGAAAPRPPPAAARGSPCRSPTRLAAAASRAPAADRCAPPAPPARWPAPRAARSASPGGRRRGCPARCPDSISDLRHLLGEERVAAGARVDRAGQRGDARVVAEEIRQQLARSPRGRAASAGSAGTTTSASSRRGTPAGSSRSSRLRLPARASTMCSRNSALAASSQCRSSIIVTVGCASLDALDHLAHHGR